LAVDPIYLARPAPPADIYGGFTWLALQVYKTSSAVASTLKNLPSLYAQQLDAATQAELLRELLTGSDGLSFRAQQLSSWAQEFAQHLQRLGGDLDAASADLVSARQRLEDLATQNQDRAVGPNVHGRAVSLGHALAQASLVHQAAAAKVSALSVIDNMRLAAQALATAWEAASAQFQAAAALPADVLGDLEAVRTRLSLTVAVSEWNQFAGATSAFIRHFLVTQ
jgi:hypothetical protein